MSTLLKIVFCLLFLGAAGTVIPTPLSAADLPHCLAHAKTVNARAVSVRSDDATIGLAGGRQAVLEGIRFPWGRQDHGPVALQKRAIEELTARVAGKAVILALQFPVTDRYGRLRAQIFLSNGIWLQDALLRLGLARVAFAPDRSDCPAPLYAAERAGRSAKAGLWMSSVYAIHSAVSLPSALGTFQIVEGRVITAAVKHRRAYLDFGADWRSDFTVTIAPDDMKAFQDRHFDPRALSGKWIRVRGILDRYHGPEIAVANPDNIEVLDGP